MDGASSETDTPPLTPLDKDPVYATTPGLCMSCLRVFPMPFFALADNPAASLYSALGLPSLAMREIGPVSAPLHPRQQRKDLRHRLAHVVRTLAIIAVLRGYEL